jgi:hypothetical protein
VICRTLKTCWNNYSSKWALWSTFLPPCSRKWNNGQLPSTRLVEC